MPTRVLLTVDTELTWRHHSAEGGWEENFERSYEAAGVGIPYQLEVLKQHDLKACFFVDPMPALAFGIEPVRRMVEPILAAGQEVQLHIHPFWKAIARGETPTGDWELTAFGAAEQRELIATARDLLRQAGAADPIAFRSGSYAANSDTLAALSQLGFRYDSSHNGSHQASGSAIPLPADAIAPVEIGGVIELPVTQIEQSAGRLRHLQVCAVSFRELCGALMHAAVNRHPAVTIVSHSFELATRDGRRAHGLVQGRFVKLCAWLAANRAHLPTAFFTDLVDLPLDVEARPFQSDRLRTAGRVVEQLWGGTRYERPAEALTAMSGSGITGLEVLIPFV